MAEEMLYREILDQLEPGWRDSPDDEGNAGIAVTAYVLQNGRATLTELRTFLPEFDADAIRTGRENLLAGNGLHGKPTDCEVHCSKDELQDGFWWTLQGCVAKGWMEVNA